MARVIVIGFPGVQTLDAAGPAEVFAAASRDALRDPRRGELRGPAYDVVLASTSGRPVRTTSGFTLETTKLAHVRVRRTDTVLVAGGEEAAIRSAVNDHELLAFVRRAATTAARTASVCSGAFVLAAAGVLDGLRAATHWSSCAELAAFRPAVQVDANAIYVRDGRIWTSAGVTTGIDMALAMVEEDLGRAVSDRVAARLVLYARRPGFQSQFTDALISQRDGSDPLGVVIQRARAQLRSLDVPRLARLSGMSVRTLQRRCHEALGTTPRRLLEKLRVEHARMLLTSTSRSHKSIAHACGFTSVAQLRVACERELGVTPTALRTHF